MKKLPNPKYLVITALLLVSLSLLGASLVYVNRPNISFDSRSSAFSPSNHFVSFQITQPELNIINQDGDSIESPASNLAWIGNAKSKSSSYLGLRFDSIDIDPKMELEEAFLELSASDAKFDRDDLSQLDVEITAEKGAKSDVFSKSKPPSKRPDIGVKNAYSVSFRWKDSIRYYINITGVVRKLLDNDASPQNITLLVHGVGATRDLRYFYTGEDNAPRLLINYK